MKDFQDQNLNMLQTKINELQEENSRLRAKMLTESDVKMIVSKAVENSAASKADANDENGRRKSHTFNEPISLKIKGGKGRFYNGINRSGTTKDSTDSDNKNKEPTHELCEQMNKFLKASQEHNAEIMREMKTMNQNMSACFTTMSMALNKLAGKIDSSGPVKQTQSYLSNSSSFATSSNLKPSQAEEVKIPETAKPDLQTTNTVPENDSISNEPEANLQNSKNQVNPSVPQDPIIQDETHTPASQDVDEIITIAADLNKVSN